MTIHTKKHRLKQAIREIVRSNGGVEAAVEGLRVQKTHLARYGSANDMSYFMPIDIVCELEAKCSKPIVTHALAHELGFELFRIPPTDGEGQVSEQLRKVFKESGEVFVAGADALADNRVDEEEAIGLLKETDEAIGALVRLQKLLERRIEGRSEVAAA